MKDFEDFKIQMEILSTEDVLREIEDEVLSNSQSLDYTKLDKDELLKSTILCYLQKYHQWLNS